MAKRGQIQVIRDRRRSALISGRHADLDPVPKLLNPRAQWLSWLTEKYGVHQVAHWEYPPVTLKQFCEALAQGTEPETVEVPLPVATLERIAKLENQRAKMKALYDNRRKAGVCTRCGQNKVEGKWRDCYPCRLNRRRPRKGEK